MLILLNKISDSRYEVFDTRTGLSSEYSATELQDKDVEGYSADGENCYYETITAFIETQNARGAMFHDATHVPVGLMPKVYRYETDCDGYDYRFEVQVEEKYVMPEIDAYDRDSVIDKILAEWVDDNDGIIQIPKYFYMFPTGYSGLGMQESNYRIREWHSEDTCCMFVNGYFDSEESMSAEFEHKPAVLERFHSRVFMIGEKMFNWCPALKEVILDMVVLPDVVSEYLSLLTTPNFIGDSAFSYCDALEKVCITGRLLKVSQNAFLGCVSLRTLELPDTISVIEAHAFSGCAFREFVGYHALEKLGWCAFANCISLRRIDLSRTQIRILENKVCKNCPNLEEVHLPSGLTTIENLCFGECPKLHAFRLPDNIEHCQISAFETGSGSVELLVRKGSKTEQTIRNALKYHIADNKYITVKYIE